MAIDMTDPFQVAAGRSVLRQSDLADQIGRDNHSLLLADHRSITAMVAREIGEAPTAQDSAALNTAARTPTTLDHYALGAGWPSGGGAAPGGGGQGGQAGAGGK